MRIFGYEIITKEHYMEILDDVSCYRQELRILEDELDKYIAIYSEDIEKIFERANKEGDVYVFKTTSDRYSRFYAFYDNTKPAIEIEEHQYKQLEIIINQTHKGE